MIKRWLTVADYVLREIHHVSRVFLFSFSVRRLGIFSFFSFPRHDFLRIARNLKNRELFFFLVLYYIVCKIYILFFSCFNFNRMLLVAISQSRTQNVLRYRVWNCYLIINNIPHFNEILITIFEINNWKFIICDSYIVIIKINSRKIREYNISLSESHSCFESCVRLISKYICKYVSPSIEIRLVYEYYCTNQSKTNSVTKRTHPTNWAHICRSTYSRIIIHEVEETRYAVPYARMPPVIQRSSTL